LLPQLHGKVKVQEAYLFRYRYPHRAKESTDGGLNRIATQPHCLLEYPVRSQYPHLIWPTIAHKHPVKTSKKQIANAVLTFPSAFYFNIPIQHLFNLVTTEKSSDQTSPTKTGQIAATELLFYLSNFFIAFCGLLGYSNFHFLSASFVVLVVFLYAYLYYIWRHFSLKIFYFVHNLGSKL